MMKDEDFKLLKGFALGQTDGQTFAIVELLLRLKKCELSQFWSGPSPNPPKKCET